MVRGYLCIIRSAIIPDQLPPYVPHTVLYIIRIPAELPVHSMAVNVQSDSSTKIAPPPPNRSFDIRSYLRIVIIEHFIRTYIIAWYLNLIF